LAKRINVHLTNDSIASAAKELRRYAAWVEQKEVELCTRLAQIGLNVAKINFEMAAYDGLNDVTVRVDQTGSVAVIYAEGSAVAFIEFGSGAKYGYGHPDAAKHGFGPGTYPSDKGLWNNEKGWWFGSGQHTYGNAPAMGMYKAVQAMTEQITQIAREVFST
jgi:hypothetical protein